MMEESRKGKTIKSAFDSATFDADVSFHVNRKVGSATISPSGRDIALASFVFPLCVEPSDITNLGIL